MYAAETEKSPGDPNHKVPGHGPTEVPDESDTGYPMTPAGTKVIAYVRVSTAEQEDSGLGLDAQRAAIDAAAAYRHWDLVDVVAETASAKSLKRPALQAALAELEAGRADALLVAKLDRLSRSLVDFGALLERAKKHNFKIVVLDMDLDMTTAAGEMAANVMMAFAQYERRLIGERTRAALGAKVASGATLGRPSRLAHSTVARIVAERSGGATADAIAKGLNADAVPTSQGGAMWYPSTVRAILRRVSTP